MDGPQVKWTVNDLFADSSPETFMTYHVMGAGWDFGAPAGCVLGGILGIVWRPMPLMPMMGTGGLALGCLGMAGGLAGMQQAINKGDEAKPLPWNEDGIQMRVNGLQHNYMVRIFDKCSWIGLSTAALAVAIARPRGLGLSSGFLGVGQALALGSSLGGAVAAGLTFQSKQLPKDDVV